MTTVVTGGGLNVTGSPYLPSDDCSAWTTGAEVGGKGADEMT